jgi:hypothetical protein
MSPSGHRRTHGAAGSRAAATLLAVALLAGAPPAAAQAPAPTAPPPPERLLLIALDAVPYATVVELTDPARGERALFHGFAGPAAMVSSFPSGTNVAMVGLLAPFGAQPSPGYEPRFFDHDANRLRGAGPISYHRLEFPWREVFDWQKTGLVSGMVTKLRLIHSTEHEIDAALDDFVGSSQPVYLIYIGDTDGIGHLKGPAALRPVLARLDADLGRLHARGVRFHTVLFSDHGMAGGTAPLVNVRRGVRRALRAAGFSFAGRLRGPGDVVIAELGMVSNFEVHTQPGYAGVAAAALADVPGVELCAYRNGDGWEVVGADGSAWFGRRQGGDGVRWAYRPRHGDPLAYAPVVARLAADPAVDGNGGGDGDWFPERAWFQATFDRRYPDALHRLADSFSLVTNPASLTCSVAPGSMYGAFRTAFVARLSIGHLRRTHGALDRTASLGFVLSDLPGWSAPEAVRFDRALVPFAHAAEGIEARAGTAAAGPPTAPARRRR